MIETELSGPAIQSNLVTSSTSNDPYIPLQTSPISPPTSHRGDASNSSTLLPQTLIFSPPVATDLFKSLDDFLESINSTTFTQSEMVDQHDTLTSIARVSSKDLTEPLEPFYEQQSSTEAFLFSSPHVTAPIHHLPEGQSIVSTNTRPLSPHHESSHEAQSQSQQSPQQQQQQSQSHEEEEEEEEEEEVPLAVASLV